MSDTLPDLRNIESPFNACMHREHCKGWKALAARQQAQVPEGWKLLEDGKTMIPNDWTWCRMEWEPGYPEDVAFGPVRMMERLKKWLDGYFAMLAAAPQAAQPEPSCIYPACHHNGCTEQCKKQPEQAQQPLTTCHAGRDGDCIHPLCPQVRDGEPRKSGRHCPLDEEEERC